jgi:hypothetical protein
MKQTGYIIENSLSKDTYFTSSSAYDRPEWVQIDEATVYASAESAEAAMKKLIRYGVNRIRIVNLHELHVDTLKSYKEKAQADNQKRADSIRSKGQKVFTSTSIQPHDSDEQKKHAKRADGINTAVRKIVKQTGEQKTAQKDKYQLGGRDETSGRSYNESEELDEFQNIEFEFPDGERMVPGEEDQLPPEDDMEGIEGEDESDMIAQDSEEVCVDCEHEPCTCDPEDEMDTEMSDDVSDLGPEDEFDPEADPEGEFDPEADPESSDLLKSLFSKHAPEENEEVTNAGHVAPKQRVSYKGATYVVAAVGNGVALIAPETEPAARIKVAVGDLLPVHESEEVGKLEFKNGLQNTMPEMGSLNHEDVVKVPSNVLSDLKGVIDAFEKEAGTAAGRDTSRTEFCLTVAGALSELRDHIAGGTVESIKRAQIFMTSLMGPISSNIPPSVVQFVAMGGRKPTLKDLFNLRTQEKKGS